MSKDKENIMLTGGITNPLDVIEQFTYLMYMKQLDEAETNQGFSVTTHYSS